MRTTVGTAPPRADFSWYWGSQTASFVGDRLTGFAVPSLAILTLNASSAEVGVLSAIGWLAYPTLGLVAGAAFVHVPRRKVMIAGELMRFAVFATIPLAALGGWVTVTQLFIVVAVAGIATVFVDIAGQSYLPVVVTPAGLVNANAKLQSSDSLSKLAGPALAGLALKTTGPYYGLLLTALPFLTSALTRTRIKTHEHPQAAQALDQPQGRPALAPPAGAMIHRIRGGFRFVLDHPVLRPLVIGAAIRSFGTGMVDAVLLLFAYRVLGLSSLEGGLLIAAGSIGGLLGAFAANRLVAKLGTHRTLLLTGLEGVFWLAIPLCLLFAPAIVLVLIRVAASIWSPVWNVLTTSVRQNVTPTALQSTVHATARTVTSSTIPLGALTGGLAGGVLGGLLGTSIGLVLVLATGGVIAGASVLSIGRASQIQGQPS